jgi:hypothetical protein
VVYEPDDPDLDGADGDEIEAAEIETDEGSVDFSNTIGNQAILFHLAKD